MLLTRKPVGDHRGFLQRMFCASELESVFHGKSIAQINHTLTVKQGTVRGMHFQKAPHAETKIVSCLKGAVFDVAVDLRRNSPTFLKWHGEILSADNHRTFVIPEGFAHGFQTMMDDCEMLYLHSVAYHPQSDSGVNPRDPALAINWPLAIAQISDKDDAHPFLSSVR
jgi:dTDP-4-dehydrorhamnose 3,5-epimerase